jgi:hypothetical protein
LEKSLSELQNLKIVSEYVGNSENYRIMQELKNQNLKLEKESYKLLNMRIYEKLNEHLLNKVKIINKLKSDSVMKYDNVEYELYLTPDTLKVKLFTKMMEIKKAIQNLENKIGVWDIVRNLNFLQIFKNNYNFFNFSHFFPFCKNLLSKIEI